MRLISFCFIGVSAMLLAACETPPGPRVITVAPAAAKPEAARPAATARRAAAGPAVAVAQVRDQRNGSDARGESQQVAQAVDLSAPADLGGGSVAVGSPGPEAEW